jgi:ribosomal protein L7/L12
MNYKLAYEKQKELIDVMGITISYFRRYSGESERISNFMKHIEEKQSELSELEKEEDSEVVLPINELNYSAINILLEKGLRLAAIKLHFETFGGSLKDSKKICDELYKRIKEPSKGKPTL